MKRIAIAMGAGLSLAAAVYAAPPVEQLGAHVEGEILVEFREALPEAAARQAMLARSLVIRKDFSARARRGKSVRYLLKSERRTTRQLLADFAGDPNVAAVSPNFIKTAFGAILPDDVEFADQWGLHNVGQTVNGTAGTVDADIDAPEAWDLGRENGDDVVIAVIDTGVDYTHPDLAPHIWVNPGEIPDNSIDDDGNGYVDDVHGYDFAGDDVGPPDSVPQDVGDHGTHVAGIAAAVARNAIGVAGVSRARIMILKASSDGVNLDDADTIEAIEYATMMKTAYGVPVVAINASYGCEFCANSVERLAIEAAGDAGIVFCAAAGNDGQSNQAIPTYPASHNSPSIVAVAASDLDDNLADFSNYGSTRVDLAAPGVEIKSTIPLHMGTDPSVVSAPDTYTANPMIFAGVTTGITELVYHCGIGNPGDFPAQVSGRIALIERGTLYFQEKAQNAMAAGAVAAIIYNNIPDNFLGTLITPGNWIPVVALSQADGQALLAKGVVPATVINRPEPSLSYAFKDGTSMATPMVAGAIAFLAQQFPAETVAQRIARLLAAVDPAPDLAGKMVTGGRLNLLKAVDTDVDGLPDWWEGDFIGDLATLSAVGDFDGDGLVDRHEYLAGTDPGVTASSLRFLGVDSQGGAGVSLSWQSASNRSYAISRAPALTQPFVPVATNLVATPPENVFLDPTAVDGGPYFYRIELEP